MLLRSCDSLLIEDAFVTSKLITVVTDKKLIQGVGREIFSLYKLCAAFLKGRAVNCFGLKMGKRILPFWSVKLWVNFK